MQVLGGYEVILHTKAFRYALCTRVHFMIRTSDSPTCMCSVEQQTRGLLSRTEYKVPTRSYCERAGPCSVGSLRVLFQAAE